MNKHLSFIVLLLLLSLNVLGQSDAEFRFENPNQRSTKIKFELVNNLIIIPVEFNGVELSFLLDSGVNKSLLLGIDIEDSTQIDEYEKIKVIGLGTDNEAFAYKSEMNNLKIGDAFNTNTTVFFLLDEEFELSSKLGIPVQGIIGYDLLKDFVVRINYKTKTIKLYNPSRFNRKLRRFQKLPLQFYNNKAFMQVQFEDETISKENLNLLFDTGSGDSFWLFEKDSIQLPKENFDDIIGYGIASIIKGKRSLVRSAKIGEIEIDKPKVAYPDMSSVFGQNQIQARDGSVGGEILKRFKLFIDYPNNQIYVKQNDNLDDPFHYDMSGIILQYAGFQLVKTYKNIPVKDKEPKNSPFPKQQNLKVITEILPSLKIVSIREDSPADKADLQVGDEILAVNNKGTYLYQLDDLQDLFSEEEGKVIKMVIKRSGFILDRQFKLKNRLKRFDE